MQRHGFHGLSYKYIIVRLGAEADGRVIIAHLGIELDEGRNKAQSRLSARRAAVAAFASYP
jgi:acetate kinase